MSAIRRSDELWGSLPVLERIERKADVLTPVFSELELAEVELIDSAEILDYLTDDSLEAVFNDLFDMALEKIQKQQGDKNE